MTRPKWSHEAFGYAMLITNLVESGIVTDDAIASAYPDPEQRERIQYIKSRALNLFIEGNHICAEHAREALAEHGIEHAAEHGADEPEAWLDEVNGEDPDDTMRDLAQLATFRAAMVDLLPTPPSNRDLIAMVNLYSELVAEAARYDWAESSARSQLVQILRNAQNMPED